MNLNRLTLTRACFVSLLTVAPAGPAMAAQLQVGGFESGATLAKPNAVTPYEDAAALREARSILEPIEAKPTQAKKPVAKSQVGAGSVAQPVSPAKTATEGSTLGQKASMFDQLDAILAATVQRDAVDQSPATDSLKTAGYDSYSPELSIRRVGQASAEMPTSHHQNSTFNAQALASDDAILIHPPTTRPTAPNRHYFQIENASARSANNVVVELEVPSNVCIIEVVPCHTAVIDKTARYKFPSIAAGETKTIELTTTPNLEEEVVFESRFSMEHVRRLATKSLPHKVDVWSPKKAAVGVPAIAAAAEFGEGGSIPAITTGAVSGSEDNGANARPGRIANEKSKKNETRLNYGAVGVPGKVMVANPEMDSSQLSQRSIEQVEPVGSAQQLELAAATTSSATATNALPQPAVDRQASEPVVPSESAVAMAGVLQSQLKTKIDGPQHAVTGEEAEYRVLVENTSTENVDEVLVQLKIPAGLEVTVLDRNAWFDGAARTITWKLPSVNAGDSETIRYLAKIVSPDGQLQKVTLGSANQFRGQAIFQSTVMDQYELAAPLLPFEKDAKSLK